MYLSDDYVAAVEWLNEWHDRQDIPVYEVTELPVEVIELVPLDFTTSTA